MLAGLLTNLIVDETLPALFDTGTGLEAVSVTAYVNLVDTGFGSDELVKSFILPPITDLPSFDVRVFSAPDEIRITPTTAEDQATGSDLLSVSALLAVQEKGTGIDELSVDKRYPQLEAFTWLLAA